MDYCRSVLAVAGANFRRLKRDARVWFIFVFTALLRLTGLYHTFRNRGNF